MPIDNITAAQFRTQIRTAISARDATQDTGYGPIRDIVIDPMSVVLEAQNARIRRVSSLLSLTNVSDFSEADLDAFVFNEGLTRSLGSSSTVMLTFSVRVAPTSDIVVQRGYPVSTSPDTATNSSLTFVVTESATMFAGATLPSYFNSATALYELSVPAICVSGGSAGNVAANRVNTPARPLIGFDSVTNPNEAVGGLDGETNAKLVERFLLAVTGRQRATVSGVERFALDSFPDISDAAVVYGTNPLLTRGATDAGAVDLYVIGEQKLAAQTNAPYLGVGQLIQIANPPLITVNAVTDAAPTNYVEGTDYEVVYDSSGVGGSTRAADGIKFLAGGTLPAAVGTLISVEYSYNNLIRNAQGVFDDPDNLVLGQDLLVRQGTKVDMQLSANLTVYSGFNPTTVDALVSNTLVAYFAALGLGDNVEISDIQLEVRRISGVDNFVITNLAETTSTVINTQDVVIGENKYARIEAANVNITIT